MGRADYWKPGDPSAICDRCGFKFKLSELKKEWDGLMVCYQCWEPRQPQDFVRGVPDMHPIPNARPQPPDNFVTGFATVPVGATIITVGASPFTFSNPSIFPIEVNINDGSVSNVTVNGVSESLQSNVSVIVPRGQSLTVTYSIVPTMFYTSGAG